MAAALQNYEKHALAQQPWPQYGTDAHASFCVAYNEQGILLQYQVIEQNIRAVHTTVNAPVYEDSCVEFFIAPDNQGYYNFEFNCIGTTLAAYGMDKQHRMFLPVSPIQSIRTESRINQTAGGLYQWELSVHIPFTVFQHHPAVQWSGLQCRANFYKCGDALPLPHFLSWTHIDAPAPDFHLPQFFGTLHFEA